MSSIRMFLLAAIVGASTVPTWSQPGSGMGPGSGAGPMGAGPGASGAARGMGMGPGGGRGAAHVGADHTPGWALMTPQERTAHRDRMRSMKTYEECTAYRDQHHREMAARAKERGGQPLATPRRDACMAMKP